ncbi:MAG: sortase [Chloroflexota bacterium]
MAGAPTGAVSTIKKWKRLRRRAAASCSAHAARREQLGACCVVVVALLFSVGSTLAAPSPSPAAPPVREADGRATRVAIPRLGVDLPVVSEEMTVPGNEPGYPLCDVAQYLEEFEDPGQPGTTYIYAHARTGMFAPLLAASLIEDGRSLLGLEALLYTSDARLHTYRIFLVKRHATDLSLARDVPPGERRLVLQTSEGPRGTFPILQVAARLVSTVAADLNDAHPVAHPRACLDPVPPLVSRRVLAVAGVGLVALLAVVWWLRKKRRHGRPSETPPA